MSLDQISTASEWRSARRSSRASRAEPLQLPSGATILAARPEPLEWILAGRLPQRLLAAALGDGNGHPRERGDPPLDSRLRGNDTQGERGNDNAEAGALMTREEVLELAQFAAQLVRASVVGPAIGDGADKIRLDDIPVEDRAFIFEWACRAIDGAKADSAEKEVSSPSGDGLAARAPSDGLERFCAK